MAADRGIDLAGISGSGPEGRVVARDLAQAGARQTAAPGAARAPAPSPALAGVTGPAYTDTPLTQIRKTIAKRLSESNGPIPTFFLTAEFDVTRAAEMLEMHRQALQHKLRQLGLGRRYVSVGGEVQDNADS